MDLCVLNFIIALSTIIYNVDSFTHQEFIKFPQTLVVKLKGCKLTAYNVKKPSERINFIYTNTCYAGNFTELPISIEKGAGSTKKILYDAAWDFVTEKIYAIPTDESLKTSDLMVIDTKNNKYTILLSNLDSPRHIELDPLSGLMFIGLSSSIIKANMDGTEIKKIVENTKATSLSIDYYKKRIFWIDNNGLKSWFAEYDGRNSKLWFKGTNYYDVLSVATLNNQVFTADYYHQEFLSNVWFKKSVDSSGQYYLANLKQVRSIEIYDLELMNSTLKLHVNPCDENYCQHLCLLTNSTKRYSCVTGFNINDNPELLSEKIIK